MKNIKLPTRAFNSPLIRYANFADGSHVNLIRLHTPYANGDTYAIHTTNTSPYMRNGLFKTYDRAKTMFDNMVTLAQTTTKLVKEAETQNAI